VVFNNNKLLKINKLNKKNIPNIITLFRIILILPIIALLEKKLIFITWFLIIIGGLSDYLDGFIANKFNFKSKFGSILDPLADKILILIPFTWLCINNIIPFWSFSLIIIRELIISTIRKTKDNGMPAIYIAKFKSFFQYLTLILLFYPIKNELILNFGILSYWISFVLCIYSLFAYLRFK